jgi:hypothetical protein
LWRGMPKVCTKAAFPRYKTDCPLQWDRANRLRLCILTAAFGVKGASAWPNITPRRHSWLESSYIHCKYLESVWFLGAILESESRLQAIKLVPGGALFGHVYSDLKRTSGAFMRVAQIR